VPPLPGLRPTRQRRAILQAVADEQRPVSAQDLHARLRRAGEPAGLATVYRTLQALADSGVLRTFQTPTGEVAYKVCEPGHHHHLICTRCGRVEEIPSCEVEEWAASVAKRRGFSVSSHQADIYGVCARCAKRRRSG
jgi:Fur family transcriptional regulator, ferric uptake regulator